MTGDKKTTQRLGAESVLVLVTFFWGCTFPIVKETIKEIPLFFFLALRFGLAAIFILPLLYNSRITRQTFIKGLILGVLLFLSFAFQTLGLSYTSASICAFITGLSVVWVALVTGTNYRTLLSVVFAVAGLWLLANPSNVVFPITWEQIKTGTVSLTSLETLTFMYSLLPNEEFTVGLGEILTFICSLFIAWHIIILARLDNRANSAELAVLQFVVVALLSLVTMAFLAILLNTELLIVPEHLAKSLGVQLPLLPKVWSGQLIFAIVLTTLGATVFAFWAQTHFQRRTTAIRASLIFIMEPLFAALFAVSFYDEKLAETAVIGGILIMLAMAVSVTKKQRISD